MANAIKGWEMEFLDMKRLLGELRMETSGDRVRVTLGNGKTKQTKHAPAQMDIAELISQMRGYWPDRAVLIACGEISRAACRSGAISE